MIINNIENYTYAQAMRCVYESPEMVRMPVHAGWRELENTIVPPVEFTLKFSYRKDLKNCDTDSGKLFKFSARDLPGTLSGESPDMYFIEYISLL